MLRHPPRRPRRGAFSRRLLLVLIAAALASATTAHAQLALPAGFVDEQIIGGFDQSVGMAFLPDGRLFVVEKASARVRLVVIPPGGGGAFLAPDDPVLTVPDVDADILEEGLLGIAVDPRWPARPYIYVYYSYLASPNIRISRFKAAGDLAFTGNGSLTIDPATRYDILTDIPDDFPYHNGGTLRFGLDGMLYVSIGDDGAGAINACVAQDLTLLMGKILRLDVSGLPDGSGGPPAKSLITPPDNPHMAHPHPNARLVAHRGMRNPFRFGIDAITGALVVGDVGFETQEEMNYLTGLGRNLQWPIYEGDIPGPITCLGVDSSAFIEPIHIYGRDEGFAVVAGVIYRQPFGATQPFPSEYDGDIFFNDFYSRWVRRLKKTDGVWSLEPTRGQPAPSDWGFGHYWISDWLVASDGTLWYCRLLSEDSTGPGEIRRIRYGWGTTSVPAADGARLEFASPFPSPARDQVRLEYRLPEVDRVSLAIYDVAGRQVRALADGEPQPAGPRHVVWDGRDAEGRRAVAGVYRARLSAAGRVLERRFVWLP